MSEDLQHVGVMGMHWGSRKGSSSGSSGGGAKRHFTPASLTKNMDGRKVNKLFGKRNRAAMGKGIVDALMTPSWSKTKWTDMDSKQKKKALLVSAAALTVVGAITLHELHGLK